VNQQEEEILILDQFKKYFPDFPKGKLLKSESPDFIVKLNTKKTIGIELTRLDQKENTFFESIEATLKNKSSKFNLYQRKKFASIWLIIHTDFIEGMSLFNLQEKLDNQNFETVFDKVYLFDLFENEGFIVK